MSTNRGGHAFNPGRHHLEQQRQIEDRSTAHDTQRQRERRKTEAKQKITEHEKEYQRILRENRRFHDGLTDQEDIQAFDRIKTSHDNLKQANPDLIVEDSFAMSTARNERVRELQAIQNIRDQMGGLVDNLKKFPLESESRRLARENEGLRGDNERLTRENQEIDTLRQTNDQLAEENKKLEQEKKEHLGKIAEQANEISKLAAKNSRQAEEIEKLERESKELQESQKKDREKIADLEKQLEALRSQVSELNSENRTLQLQARGQEKTIRDGTRDYVLMKQDENDAKNSSGY